MKDFDIKVPDNCKVTLFGTDNGTIVVPASVIFDSDRGQADIEIKDVTEVEIGIPKESEHIEINLACSSLTLRNLAYERIEIDCRESAQIDIENAAGAMDINIMNGQVTLMVPAGYEFTTRNEGRDTSMEYSIPTTANARNVIELNGKNSVLSIVNR